MSESAYVLFRRGSALLSEGLAAEAAEHLAQATSLEPAKTSIREALARAYFATGRFGRATDEFRRIAELDPTNDYAHFGLALCLERKGDRAQARGHAKLAVAMRPDNDEYRRVLGRLEPSQ